MGAVEKTMYIGVCDKCGGYFGYWSGHIMDDTHTEFYSKEELEKYLVSEDIICEDSWQIVGDKYFCPNCKIKKED